MEEETLTKPNESQEDNQEVVNDNDFNDENEEIDLDELKTKLKSEEPQKESDEPKEESQSIDDLEKLYQEQQEKGFNLEKPIVAKVDGKLLKIDDPKDVASLINKGLDYTKKTQELAQYRNTLQFLSENGLDNIDALKQALVQGVNPEAIQETPAEVNEVEQVASTILSSPDADDFKSLVSQLPDEAKGLLQSDARVLSGLYGDFKSGLAQQALPLVHQYMAVKGMDFISAYLTAGSDIKNNSQKASAKKDVLSSEPKAKGKKTKLVDKDLFELSDEEFEKEFSRFKQKYQ